MPESQKNGIQQVIDEEDWSLFAGPGAAVRERGVAERRHRQWAAVTMAVAATVAVGAAVIAGQPAETKSAASPVGPAASSVSAPPAVPTTPILVQGPWKVLQSGVLGGGVVNGRTWQVAYRVIPSQAATNSSTVVTCVDVTSDATTANAGCVSGATWNVGGYQARDGNLRSTGDADPLIVGYGTVPDTVTAVALQGKDGSLTASAIVPAVGSRFAAFAWDRADAPTALVQTDAAGPRSLAITNDTNPGMWVSDPTAVVKPTPSVKPSSVVTPTGPPIFGAQDEGRTLSSGILGGGTVGGHQWQTSYRFVPSGSAANVTNRVYCTDDSYDGKALLPSHGCTSWPTLYTPMTSLFFTSFGAHSSDPLVRSTFEAQPGTTAAGLEWADGTQAVTPTVQIEGAPVFAVAFAPDSAPAFVVEYGSYGEYKVPLKAQPMSRTWTFRQ